MDMILSIDENQSEFVDHDVLRIQNQISTRKVKRNDAGIDLKIDERRIDNGNRYACRRIVIDASTTSTNDIFCDTMNFVDEIGI
jgi:hypothetical protein